MSPSRSCLGTPLSSDDEGRVFGGVRSLGGSIFPARPAAGGTKQSPGTPVFYARRPRKGLRQELDTGIAAARKPGAIEIRRT